MSAHISFEEMLTMSKQQVKEVFQRGFPIPIEDIGNSQYLGVDLGMPEWFHKLAWKTFRKTFYKDPDTGIIRGWNVKVEQTGYNFPLIPKKNSKGEELSFGHYHLLPAKGKKFPEGWEGENYLDYGVAGNPPLDVAALGYCPLVAVNEGSADLLLGWEVFKIGNLFVPLNDYWVLKKEGQLQVTVPPPVRKH